MSEYVISSKELAVIEALLKLAYEAWNVADNSEDTGQGHIVYEHDYDALSEALDALDALPDDQPGYVMEAAAKARWALRGLLAAAPREPAPAVTRKPRPVAWYVFADTEHWVTMDEDEADQNRDQGCQVRPLVFGDATPPAPHVDAELQELIDAAEWVCKRTNGEVNGYTRLSKALAAIQNRADAKGEKS